jgi:type IV pilus assembly protein PilV
MIHKDADMKMHRSLPNKQTGSMLLEGLISILLFSIGILAIVGLQAASIKMVGDAKYRSDASLLADQLIGRMWAGNLKPGSPCTPSPCAPQSDFGSPGGTQYTNWLNSVYAALPGVSGVPANQPTVTFTTNILTAAPTSIATITIFWSSPDELAKSPPISHKHTVVAEII